MLSDSSSIDECAPLSSSALQRGAVALQWFMWLLVCIIGWLVLLAIKLVLGIRLHAFAHHRQIEAVARKTEDVLTNLQTPIGEGPEDKVGVAFEPLHADNTRTSALRLKCDCLRMQTTFRTHLKARYPWKSFLDVRTASMPFVFS